MWLNASRCSTHVIWLNDAGYKRWLNACGSTPNIINAQRTSWLNACYSMLNAHCGSTPQQYKCSRSSPKVNKAFYYLIVIVVQRSLLLVKSCLFEKALRSKRESKQKFWQTILFQLQYMQIIRSCDLYSYRRKCFSLVRLIHPVTKNLQAKSCFTAAITAWPTGAVPIHYLRAQSRSSVLPFLQAQSRLKLNLPHPAFHE